MTTDLRSWEQNPWFGERALNVWNDWPYLARWKGLSEERRKEIEMWTLDNLQGLHSTYYTAHFNVFGVVCMDFNDLLMLKLGFHDIV